MKYLVENLTAEETWEGSRLMQEYIKELDQAQKKAKTWSLLLGRAEDGHARLQTREHAKKIAECYKESVKYWPAGLLMAEWFQPGTNQYKCPRVSNEDLDPIRHLRQVHYHEDDAPSSPHRKNGRGACWTRPQGRSGPRRETRFANGAVLEQALF